MLELTRHIGYENARLKAGAPWQTTIGLDLEGMTLGILGLGKLGTRMAEIGQAFGMNVIAWSQNLTPERCQEAGVEPVQQRRPVPPGRLPLHPSAIVAAHARPRRRQRTRPDEAAAPISSTHRAGRSSRKRRCIAALREKRIAGAGLDVFDIEPLPVEHPLRTLDNVVLTPHLGYVVEQNYRAFFGGTVEAIRGFLDGKPVRVLT